MNCPYRSLLAAEELNRDSLAQARIVPLRQEQLQERLGERLRELDTPLLVEWPNGRREALLFVIEEETGRAGFPFTDWRTTASIWPNCSTPSAWFLWSSFYVPVPGQGVYA